MVLNNKKKEDTQRPAAGNCTHVYKFAQRGNKYELECIKCGYKFTPEA